MKSSIDILSAVFVVAGVALLVPPTVSGRAVCSNISRKNLEFCKDIPYNSTSFPNILGHSNINKASMELSQYAPLIKVGCSELLESFLCSVYVPLCSEEHYGIVFPPCRSFCKKAKAGCSELMNRFGFKWPSYLDCKSFPVKSNETLCLTE